MVEQLTSAGRKTFLVKEESSSTQLRRKLICQILYTLSKVRGYKVLLKRFPHEISDLEPLWDQFESGNLPEFEWETRYVLLLWLSLIVMNPFHLEVVVPREKIDHIIEFCTEKGLSQSGKVAEGCCIFLSRLLTQPDMKADLCKFLDWCIEKFSSGKNDRSQLFLRLHILLTLSRILKHAKREDLLTLGEKGDFLSTRFFPDFVRKFLPDLCDYQNNRNSLLRKFAMKVVQRLGLIFLKPKVVSWRYTKTRRVLLGSKKKKKDAPTPKSGENEESMDVESERSFAKHRKEVEFVLTQLLSGLTDKDTVVRWSSAKGIGRITFRLPRSFADEVVQNILGLFSHKLSSVSEEYRMHGGCLSLAELSRRGLLLPERLDEVISSQVLIRAMVYDELQGRMKCSSGQNVRDASCYVCWSFGRAYESEVLRPYLRGRVFPVLLALAVFDREINVRRAAAAAFQENVGRHEQALQGDEVDENEKKRLLTLIEKVNYFALSNRKRCYLNVSLEVVDQHPELFLLHFIEHLVKYKVGYWDRSLREHASKILPKLVIRYLSQEEGNTERISTIKKIFIDTLVENIRESFDLNVRHGCLLTLSEFLLELHKHIQEKKVGEEEKAGFLESLFPGVSESLVQILPVVVDRNRICEPEESGYRMIQDSLCFFIYGISVFGYIQIPANFKIPKRKDDDDDDEYDSSEDEEENEGEEEEEQEQEQVNGVEYFQEILDNCLKISGEEVSNFALDAFLEFTKRYHLSDPKRFLEEVVEKRYLKELQNPNRVSTAHKMCKRGYLLALGQVDSSLLLGSGDGRAWFKKLLSALCEHILPYTTDPKKKVSNDVESRRNAVIGLTKFCMRNRTDFLLPCGADLIATDESVFHLIFRHLSGALGDYAVDRRGDVGSWVREVSMVGIRDILLQSFEPPSELKIEEHVSLAMRLTLVGLLMKQGVERIDKIRKISWEVVQDIRPLMKLGEFKEEEEVQEKVQKAISKTLDYYKKKYNVDLEDTRIREDINVQKDCIDSEFIFLRFLHGLRIQSYRKYVVEGLILTLGSKFPKKEFKKTFIGFMRKEKQLKMDVFQCVVKIFEENRKRNRITIPLLSFLNSLVQEMDEEDEKDVEITKTLFTPQFFQLMFGEVQRTKSLEKIGNSVSLSCSLMKFFETVVVRKKCIQFVCKVGLRSEFPRIRQHTSNEFYVVLQTYGDEFIDDEEDLDELMDSMGESDWMSNEYSKFMDVIVPILKKYLK